MTKAPTIEVERAAPGVWSWRIRHPRTGMPLLTGTKPTQRGARRAAEAHARQWTHRYGHLHTSR